MKTLSVQQEVNKILSTQIDEARKVVGIVPVKKATSSATPSLDQTMAQHAKAYDKITKAAKKSLETWLASNWELIVEFKKENDYQGNSVQHLRTKVNAAIKAQEVETLDDDTDTENEGSGEAGTDVVAKTLDVVELTEKVLALAESNNISTKDLIKALQASLKA